MTCNKNYKKYVLFLFLGFALNSILIDERLGFIQRENGKTPRLAIIPPSSPVLEGILSKNGYEVTI